MLRFSYKRFFLLYADDDDNENQDGDNSEGDADNGGTDDKTGTSRTFTQEEVNAMLATDRRKNEEKTKKVIGELEALRKSKNLTEQQQSALSERIEELQTQLMTKEELAKRDKEKLEQDYSSKVDTLSNERDTWKQRYEQTLINNAIHQAAAEHKAIDPNQMIALIQARKPRVVQELDETGNPKDLFVPRVTFTEHDSKENKEVTLDLTISEAIKRMKEQPENFNLFQSTVKGGLGLDSGEGRGSSDSPPLDDPAAYRKWRKKHGFGGN